MSHSKGKVGPFFYLHDTVVSDSIHHEKAESYGVCKTWSSHDSFWSVLGKSNKEYRNIEYFIYPRGRVTYNTEKDIYYVYLNPILNIPEVVNKIIQEYNLEGCNYVIDDSDVHYKFYTDEELDDLMMEDITETDEFENSQVEKP